MMRAWMVMMSVVVVLACGGADLEASGPVEPTDTPGEPVVAPSPSEGPGGVGPISTDVPVVADEVGLINDGPEDEGGQLEGTIVSHTNGTLTLTRPNGPAPPVRRKASLAKKIDKKLGTMSLTAWLDIASVEVESVGANVVLRVLEEKSVITVNGEKKDAFTPGATVRLSW